MAVAHRQPPSGRGLAPGTKIDRYSVIRRLARGGMAEVYLAHERSPGGIERFVALKLILPAMTGEQSFVSMFLNEARVAATLDHPNIAQVLTAGNHAGEPYMIMEFVHGETVHRILRESTGLGDDPIPLAVALELVIRACSGLHYAHERSDLNGKPLRIIHRDVSPSNLMVRFDGTVKLLDFGIAKASSQTTATETGVFKGKSGYMSPEQCADERLDRRSDVFNLGILLYELTTLHRAFFGDNPVAIINKIANARYRPPREIDPTYPPALEEIVAKALAVEPDARYATALELQLALEDFAAARRLTTSPTQVAAFMTARFGEHAYPSVDDVPPSVDDTPEPPPTEPPTRVVESLAPASLDPAPRRWIGPATAGVAILLAVGAWASFGGENEPDAAQSPPTPTAAPTEPEPGSAPAAEPTNEEEPPAAVEASDAPPEPPGPAPAAALKSKANASKLNASRRQRKKRTKKPKSHDKMVEKGFMP